MKWSLIPMTVVALLTCSAYRTEGVEDCSKYLGLLEDAIASRAEGVGYALSVHAGPPAEQELWEERTRFVTEYPKVLSRNQGGVRIQIQASYQWGIYLVDDLDDRDDRIGNEDNKDKDNELDVLEVPATQLTVELQLNRAEELADGRLVCDIDFICFRRIDPQLVTTFGLTNFRSDEDITSSQIERAARRIVSEIMSHVYVGKESRILSTRIENTPRLIDDFDNDQGEDPRYRILVSVELGAGARKENLSFEVLFDSQGFLLGVVRPPNSI